MSDVDGDMPEATGGSVNEAQCSRRRHARLAADAGAAGTSEPRTAMIASSDNIVIIAPDTKSTVCMYKYILENRRQEC